MTNDYVYDLLIGDGSVASDATGLADLANGEIMITDHTFTPLAPGSTVEDSDRIYIVQGTASGIGSIMVGPIQGRNLSKWKGTSYAAPTQQVSYIGYNGTTGAINADNLTEYTLSVVFKHDKTLWSKQPQRRHFSYTSDASATQDEIAEGLIAAMNNDEEFAQRAVAAKLTNGADRGISITGLAQTKNYIDDYEIVNFEVAIDKGFDATVGVDQYGYIETNMSKTAVNSASVNPDRGSGQSALVEDLERKSTGFRGNTNLMKFPVPDYPRYTVDGATYDLYVLEHFNRHESKDLTSKRDFPSMVVIAVPVGNTGMTTYIESIMNPYAASAGLPAVNL